MAARRSSPGRAERQRTSRGQAHRPDLGRFYRGPLADITPGEFEFTVDLLRPGRRAESLDPILEDLEWLDEQAQLTGTLSLVRADPENPRVPVGRGHVIRCRVRWGSGWYELWRMRAGIPEVDLIAGTISVPLADDLEALSRNRRDWHFRKTRARHRGWTADEITVAVCRREAVRVAHVVKGRKRIDKLVRERTSGLNMIRTAWAREREETGRRFIIRMRGGRLEVLPFRRNRVLYVIRGQIEQALLTAEGSSRPVTVIEARGHTGKGSSRKRVKATVSSRAAALRLGRVIQEKDYGRVESVSALRRRAQRDLAKHLRLRRTANLVIPGVPFIRRGDGIRWINEEPGWHGPSADSRDRSYVYVTAVRQRIAGGGEFSTDMDIAQEDPFVKDREREEREERARKRQKRKKKKGT